MLYSPPVRPDAGPDQRVCGSQTVQLGGKSQPAYTYTWSPATFLDNPNSPNPTFRYTGSTLTGPTEFTYTVALNDGTCTRKDNVTITVAPGIEAPTIRGSRSVCPGVTAVDYQVPPVPNATYRWTVVGGQVVSGQGTAAIKINWGASRPDATVTLTAQNQFGCSSTASTFSVRINPVLKTETPNGPPTVCLNQKDGVAYEVINTNGSIYTWAAQGGTIKQGQGTNRVIVDWSGLGQHSIWIREKSTTVDTVCYGASDTLRVNVFRDPTTISLTAVSVGPSSDNEATVSWSLSQPLASTQRITVLRRTAGASAWQEVAQVPATPASYTDKGVAADDYNYEYQLRTRNNCDEPLETTLHRTIRLAGVARPIDDKLDLAWNAYTGWPAADTRYELWRKVDKEEAYTLLRPLGSGNFSLTDLDALVGFEHHYKIKASSTTSGLVVWSNELDLTFEHPLVISNIFTPNGDHHNDTFRIPKLELYPENELTVFNRYGKQVFHQKNYTGNWSGSDLTNGVYYYQLFLKRLNTYHKGWVQIAK
ncbi:gliding motility-associated C-terminal domain-containing protein [Hymenobacter wooponensis]|uniref:T9SS type B sorting domain-containing protein n=1 Tax=Hymenobacter wooponensis TaxID=1525360 RepID=UPI00143689AC|nr:gliding motility-associated C-terminal domain-containing protein [Hymenobacter wooponensis]